MSTRNQNRNSDIDNEKTTMRDGRLLEWIALPAKGTKGGILIDLNPILHSVFRGSSSYFKYHDWIDMDIIDSIWSLHKNVAKRFPQGT